MDFSQALIQLKAGRKVKRTSWKDPLFKIWLTNTPPNEWNDWEKIHLVGNSTGKVCQSFTPNNDSLLAEDWEVVE